MTSWYRELAESEAARYDPLCVERSAPVDDDEAAGIEAMCLAATPGPFAVDDDTDGDGTPVVTLPDGRVLVSQTVTLLSPTDPVAIDANTDLICRARYCLLRLLRDRQQWQTERQELLDRIGELEAQLHAYGQEHPRPKRPR